MNDLAWIMATVVAIMAMIGLFLMSTQGGKKKIASVWRLLQEAFPEGKLTHRHTTEAMLETERAVYLIKAIPFHPEHELIVTNKTYWCVNDKPSQWKRSSKPELVSGVVDFLTWKPETDKRIVRIGVVAPSARNITFHINECDVVVVEPSTDVYGYRLMRQGDLPDFLFKAERK